VDFVEPIVSNIVNVFILKGSSILIESLTLNIDMSSEKISRYEYILLVDIQVFFPLETSTPRNSEIKGPTSQFRSARD
jgi:hypothetical protein